MNESPVLGVDGQGNAISVWIGQDSGSSEQLVKAAYFAAATATWSAPVTIGSDVLFPPPPAMPSLAVTTDGKAVAVWHSNVDGSIHYNVFDTTWLGEGVIDGGADENAPQVGVDALGHAVAIWLVGGSPAGTGMMSATFSFNTLLWGASSLISVDNSPNLVLQEPALSMNAAGEAVAVWLYVDTGSSTYLVQSNSYSGGIWGSQETIPSTNPATFVTPAEIYPVVTLSPTGEALALFYQYDASMTPTQDYIVLAALRNGSWATPFAVSSLGNADITKLAIGLASNGQGDAIAVWELTQGSTTNIEATTFSGFTWNNDATVIATGTGTVSVFGPRVAMSDTGVSFATWSLLDTSVPMAAIQVSQYSQGAWGSAVTISTPGDFPTVGEFFFPSIAATPTGSFVDIWYAVPPPFTGVVLQGSNITLSSLEPPSSVSGKQKINRFPVDSERFNQIKWGASPTVGVAAYAIERNGALIATVSASVLQYQDHNRRKNEIDVYAVFAVSASGARSAPVTIAIP